MKLGDKVSVSQTVRQTSQNTDELGPESRRSLERMLFIFSLKKNTDSPMGSVLDLKSLSNHLLIRKTKYIYGLAQCETECFGTEVR